MAVAWQSGECNRLESIAQHRALAEVSIHNCALNLCLSKPLTAICNYFDAGKVICQLLATNFMLIVL